MTDIVSSIYIYASRNGYIVEVNSKSPPSIGAPPASNVWTARDIEELKQLIGELASKRPINGESLREPGGMDEREK